MNRLPGQIVDVNELEAVLALPSPALIEFAGKLDGDVLILGAGGKMGPSLTLRLRQAILAAGGRARVTAVSRFSDASARQTLEQAGVATIAADLMNEHELNALPKASYVMYMLGHKFGTTGREHVTWAINSYLPGRVADTYRTSVIVSFSTGNVYPLTPIGKGGCTEEDPALPVGEYAQSCLGRERLFDYAAATWGTRVAHIRLNYANDLRYGVLREIADAVFAGRPVDLAMGHVNVIWQGDANDMALRAFAHASAPSLRLNVTGPETVSVRYLAETFGRLFGRAPVFSGAERETALLSNATRACGMFGYPGVPLARMIEWTASWVENGGEKLEKPTHFDEREGRF